MHKIYVLIKAYVFIITILLTLIIYFYHKKDINIVKEQNCLVCDNKNAKISNSSLNESKKNLANYDTAENINENIINDIPIDPNIQSDKSDSGSIRSKDDQPTHNTIDSNLNDNDFMTSSDRILNKIENTKNSEEFDAFLKKFIVNIISHKEFSYDKMIKELSEDLESIEITVTEIYDNHISFIENVKNKNLSFSQINTIKELEINIKLEYDDIFINFYYLMKDQGDLNEKIENANKENEKVKKFRMYLEISRIMEQSEVHIYDLMFRIEYLLDLIKEFYAYDHKKE